MKKIYFLFAIFILLSSTKIWSIQFEPTFYNILYGIHNFSNEIISNNTDWNYGGEADLRLILCSDFQFEENFSSDVRVDVYISKPYDTNVFITSIKECYGDLLFFERLSVKSGFLALDYGYNGTFHPLGIYDFDPAFKKKYEEIIIGSESHGYRGFPAFRVRYSNFFNDLNFSIENTIAFLNFTNFISNYFLSGFNIVYGSINCGGVIGYYPDFDNKENHPVYGGYFSFQLPFQILLLGELLYKKDSYRATITNNAVREKRSDENYLNASLELKKSLEEPFLHNKVDLRGEYFYYNEGVTQEEYDEIYDFLKNPLNLMIYGKNLIDYRRTFKHNFALDITYSISSLDAAFGYGIIFPENFYFVSHKFNLSKAYKNSVISLNLIYNHSEDKYSIFYQNQKFILYLVVGITL
ncbi:MAG: hypothetical protein ACP5Q5_00795 [Brevinematia bacterium]